MYHMRTVGHRYWDDRYSKVYSFTDLIQLVARDVAGPPSPGRDFDAYAHGLATASYVYAWLDKNPIDDTVTGREAESAMDTLEDKCISLGCQLSEVLQESDSGWFNRRNSYQKRIPSVA